MSHPLIILGAGASNGCFNDAQKIRRNVQLDFPLTNHLFDPEYIEYLKNNITSEKIKKFIDPLSAKEIKDVLDGGDVYLRQISSRLMGRESLEKEVSSLWRIAKNNNKQTQKQLITFAFYLQFLFYFLSKDVARENVGGSNYDILASEINDFLHNGKESEVTILNFNYDLLMKRALEDAEFKSRIHYKPIHGSCDNCWIFSTGGGGHRERINNFNFDEFFDPGPEEYNLPKIYETIRSGRSYIPRPTLILPFFEKQIYGDKQHKEMTSWLKGADKILIIGWSAKDHDLIELISTNTGNKLIPLTVVAGSKKDIKDVFNNFPESKFSHAAEFVNFNGFMRSPTCKTFFGTV